MLHHELRVKVQVIRRNDLHSRGQPTGARKKKRRLEILATGAREESPDHGKEGGSRYLEGAADGGDDGGGEVGARDDGHLPVPLLHRLRHLPFPPPSLSLARALTGKP